jgi:hypothetical protein
MEWILVIVAILQSVAVSLGVGSSTLAILNFFIAIKDGVIEPSERSMMGIVYVVLRIAMVIILITSCTLLLKGYGENGTAVFTPYILSIWLVIFVLYKNAILMTYKIMPSTFGPAIQASSWYTLGVLMALFSLDLINFSLPLFILAYITTIILAVSLVNGTMAIMKAMREDTV